MPTRRTRSRVLACLAVASLATGCRTSDVSSTTVLPAPAMPLVHHVHTPGHADGVVPAGTTVFSTVPAVTRLDPALLRALRRAATAAGRRGVVVYVESGWRSRAYQQQLFREAVAKYGRNADRWVAPPGTSAHERGDAVDVGHGDAIAWLSRHGAHYGLCQVYRNERWHYELRPDAARQGCPRMYADPTHDPRLHRG